MTRTLAILLLSALSCIAQPLSMHDPSFLQSCSLLRNGLAGYWRLEESSGTRYDCSKAGVHLTSNNSVGQAVGKVNNCGSFVATSSQYLSAPSSNSLQLLFANSFTLTAWVKLTNNSVQHVIGHYNVTANRGYTLQTSAAGKLDFLLASTGSALIRVIGTTVVTDSAWHFIVATYNGNKNTNGMSLFVDNGAETISSSTKVGSMNDIDNTGVFCLGFLTGDSGSYANGLIDEAGVWNRVLPTTGTASLTQLYNAGRGTHFPWAHP